MQWLLTPVIFVLNGLGNLITRMMGIPPAEAHTRLVSSKDLEYIVEESYEGGLIEASEQVLIENIFDLKERTVGQVMTPRTHITGFDVNDSAEEVLQIIYEERYSRYPIYEESLDHIIGVLHIKDLARYQLNNVSEPFDLRQFAQQRPVVHVPETVLLDEMMTRFRQEHVSLIVAVDEFGGTAGIITLEDMVEEVVGEIQDEFDVEEAPFETISEHELRVQGTLLLDELNQHYHLSLEHDEVNTVGGLIMAQLGRIPEPGDQIVFDGITFIAETMDGNAVETARLLLP
jgi:putative hemolysin